MYYVLATSKTQRTQSDISLTSSSSALETARGISDQTSDLRSVTRINSLNEWEKLNSTGLF